MSQSNLYIIREQIFNKGYNDKYPPELIPKGYMSVAKNCVITRNRIEKRKGYTLMGQDMGNKTILGLHGITTSGGTKRLYAFLSNAGATAIEIWENTGSGNWTLVNNTLLTSFTRGEVNCVNAEDVVYAFDGASIPVKITPGSPSTAAAVADVNFPKGSFGAWFHNFHFVAGVSTTKSTLYWSKLEDSDDFTSSPTGSVLINATGDNEITGLAVLGDQLIIFMKDQIWSLTGFGTTAFTVSDLNERLTGIGTKSYRSIVNVGNDLYFMTHLGGIPEIRSLRRTDQDTLLSGKIISDDIQGTMSNLNEAQLLKVAGVFDGKKVFYALPESGFGRNNIVVVLDVETKGWVKWTGLNVSCWAEFDFSNEAEIYFGESQANSLVYKLDNNAKSDNGTAIEFDVQTRRYGGDRPEIQKKWKYLYLTADSSGNHNLTVNFSDDGFDFTELDTMNLRQLGTVLPFVLPAIIGDSDIKRKRMHYAKTTSYFMQLQFYNNAANEDVVIRDWEILGKHRGLRDAYKMFA